MDTKFNTNDNSLWITAPNGAEFAIEINKDGSIELGADNGQNYEDNQYAYAVIPAGDAPDALVAIQNWIESLTKKEDISS